MVVDSIPTNLVDESLDIEVVGTVKEVGQLLKEKNLGSKIENYALMVAGKFAARDDEYVVASGDYVIGRGKLHLMQVLGDFLAYL